MWFLLPYMIERMGIIVTLAFLLTRLKLFRQVIQQETGTAGKLLIIVIFGLFGIISTYTGIEVSSQSVVDRDWITAIGQENAIANTRNLGVVIGGLLGGPVIGTIVGVIAGMHRYYLGGFTALACAISTITGGLAAGWIRTRLRDRSMIPVFAAATGASVEIFQMIVILLIAKPFSAALELVTLIGLPMIVVNGFGVWIFMQIIQTVYRDEERARAIQTQKALEIAERTLPFFRQGLNQDSSTKAAEIICRLSGADAVAITNRMRVLAHVGAGSDHHRTGQRLITKLTRKVLQAGEIITAKTKEHIGCAQPGCPLCAAVVLPLNIHGKAVGTLKLYFTDSRKLTNVAKELAEGLAKLFSNQLEFGEAELQNRLLQDAEIKALQAQVNPHFLFNALHTIIAVTRKDADVARSLLLKLAAFLRSNLQGARQTLISLDKEMEHVEAYLTLEQARFPGKFTLETDIEPALGKLLIPPFTMQPLVENAVRHGLSGIEQGGVIHIEAHSRGEFAHIRTTDNGAGIPAAKLADLGNRAVVSEQGTGTALENIKKRMMGIYAGQAEFWIESNEKGGTAVSLKVPLLFERGGRR